MFRAVAHFALHGCGGCFEVQLALISFKGCAAAGHVSTLLNVTVGSVLGPVVGRLTM